MPVDPASAISNAIAAVFYFLGTGEGQIQAAQLRVTVTDFNAKIADFVNHLHGAITQQGAPKP